MKYRKPWSRKGGHYVDGGDTDILNAALGEGEGDVEGGPDEHVGRRHQDVSQAHVAPLSHKNRIIADEGIYENLTIITLFSWCLLFVMMVMMALCMNKPRARIPVRLGNDDLEI